MLPGPEGFGQLIQQFNIQKKDDIVVYDDFGVTGACRAYWMLQTYGFENVYVLNGGYKAWKNLQNKSDVTSYTHLQNSNVTNIFIIVEIFIQYYITKYYN